MSDLLAFIDRETAVGRGDPDLGPIVDFSTLQAIRREVQRRLQTEVDPIVTNPLRWNGLGEEEKARITDYRQQLLDLTDTMADPEEIVWPTR